MRIYLAPSTHLYSHWVQTAIWLSTTIYLPTHEHSIMLLSNLYHYSISQNHFTKFHFGSPRGQPFLFERLESKWKSISITVHLKKCVRNINLLCKPVLGSLGSHFTVRWKELATKCCLHAQTICYQNELP